ncbi:sensor histidine kinase [Iningainema tapete]|uniref:histidine kinase n=1 Tax=Iningainema tapete BLCC-T55 TaxID=2748662 RepID=A0A8J6XIU1_9CYAN|nr:sensor histidine kinase [Iningainema tapete]MBD2775253.1 sensor histidine kinase [Iningainema tapete BLCC-T55]
MAFVLSILVSLIVGNTASAYVTSDVGQSLAELAYQITNQLDGGIFERYRELQIISTLDVLRDRNSVSQQRALLEKLQSTDTNYAWIGLADNQGNIVASTGKLLEGKNIAQQSWFVKGRTVNYVSDVHDDAVKLAKLLPQSNSEQLHVDIAVAIKDSTGNPQSVLGAHLRWTWSKKLHKSLLNSVNNANKEIFILSHDGNVLSAPPEFQTKNLVSLQSVKAAQSGLKSYLTETWFDRQTYLTGFAQSIGDRNYPGLGWIVLVRQKTKTAFTPIRHFQQQIFTWNMMGGGLFAVISWFLARLQMQLTSKLLAQEMRCQSEEKLQQLTQKIQSDRKFAEETRIALLKEKEISELKSRFISIASHEFRTPLTSIFLACDTLLKYQEKLPREKQRKILQQIQSSVKHLNQILEDLLLIGKTQAGKLKFNPVPINPINFCQEIIEQLQLCAGTQHKLKFSSQSTENSPTQNLTLLDEKLLRQILTNLLTNAIKYSPQESEIQINLTCDKNKVILRIQDQGIGIPKEDQPNLFNPFFRCNNTKHLPGTGLGLTIVKNAVELHNGQITVQSEEGQGTTITVTLPINYS